MSVPAVEPAGRTSTYCRVTYASVGYDRGMTTVGPDRPTAAATGAPREVAIPDEPLTAALDRAAQRWPERTAVDFLGAPTTYRGARRRRRPRRAGAARPRRPAGRPGRPRHAELHRPRGRVLRGAAHRRGRRRAQPHLHRRRARAPARRLRAPSSRSSGRRRCRACSRRCARTALQGRRRRGPVRRPAPRQAARPAPARCRAPAGRAHAMCGTVAAGVPDVAPARRQGRARWTRRTRRRRRPTSPSCSTPAGPPARPRARCSRTATWWPTRCRDTPGPASSPAPTSSTACCRSSTRSA